MTSTPPAGAPGGAIAPMNAELAATFAQMATLIPSEAGDGAERILAQILAAPSWEQLSDPWESTNALKLAGRRLLIRSCLRRPSDFRDGLGVFLVVDSIDTSTGEPVVWTTSSVAIVAQLVRAYALGQLPLYAHVVVADRATERGYHPHHLKFTGSPAPAAAPRSPHAQAEADADGAASEHQAADEPPF